MSIEFNNLIKIEEKDGVIIYEVDEKPTYKRRVSTKRLLEEKANLQEDIVIEDERALDKKAKIQKEIDGIDVVLAMITELEARISKLEERKL